jgi:hypothetical protein
MTDRLEIMNRALRRLFQEAKEGISPYLNKLTNSNTTHTAGSYKYQDKTYTADSHLEINHEMLLKHPNSIDMKPKTTSPFLIDYYKRKNQTNSSSGSENLPILIDISDSSDNYEMQTEDSSDSLFGEDI